MAHSAYMLTLLDAAAPAESGIVTTLFNPDSGNWQGLFGGLGGLVWTLPVMLATGTAFLFITGRLFPTRTHAFNACGLGGYPGAGSRRDFGVNEIDLALMMLFAIAVPLLSRSIGVGLTEWMTPEAVRAARDAAREIADPAASSEALRAAIAALPADGQQANTDAQYMGQGLSALLLCSYAVIVYFQLTRAQPGRPDNPEAAATLGTAGLLRDLTRLPMVLLLWMPLAVSTAWCSLSFYSLFVPESLEAGYKFQTQGALERLIQPSDWKIPVGILSAVVAHPLWEEFLFRGVLQGYLRRHAPWWIAGVATAVVFALVHEVRSSPQILLPVLGLGLALGWVYERTGRIWVAVGLHALHNAAVLCIGWALK